MDHHDRLKLIDALGNDVSDVRVLRATAMGDHFVLVVEATAGRLMASASGPFFVNFSGKRWLFTINGADPFGTGTPGCDPELGPNAMSVTLSKAAS